MITALLAEIDAVRSSADVGDWSACELASIRAQGLAHASAMRLIGGDEHNLALVAELHSESAAFSTALKDAAGSRPEFFAAMMDQVPEGQRESLERLAQGDVRGVPLLEDLGQIGISGPGLVMGRDLVTTAAVQGLLGRVHASFNLGAAVGREVEVERLERALVEVEEAQHRYRASLYAQLLQETSRQVRIDAAMGLAMWSERVFPAFAELQSQCFLGFRRLLEAGEGSRAERVGQSLVRAGLLTRGGIADHATGYRLALELSGGTEREDVRAVLRRASRLVASLAIPNGRDTPLARVDSEEDGAFIEVWGVVAGMESERVGEKLVSRVTLRSPVNGAEVDLVVLFAHASHAGITRGAFARASGTLRLASRFNKGGLAVEVGRIPLADLAGESWTAGTIQAVKQWTSPWRNGANLSWSLGLHRPGVEGEMGAAELKFAPPMRKA